MSDNSKVSVNLTPSLSVLLGILFVGLKLTHYVDWSWFWVTLPFWGGIALFLGITFAVFVAGGTVYVGAVILDFFSNFSRRRTRKLLNKVK